LFYDKKDIRLPLVDEFTFLHYHDRIEIGLIKSGNGIFYIGEEFFSVNTGDIVFIPYGVKHYSRSSNVNLPCFARFIYVNKHLFFNKLCNFFNEEELEKKLKSTSLVVKEKDRGYNALKSVFDKIMADKITLNFLLLNTALFLEESDSKSPSEYINTVNNDDAILAVSEYLYLNYNKKTPSKTLCEIALLSESQLRKRFLKAYKVTPIKYKNLIRLKVTVELLLNTKLPINEIAQQTGFTTESELLKAFKKEYGLSPLEFRKFSNEKFN
jgi:AraC-like DNA-binding protein